MVAAAGLQQLDSSVVPPTGVQLLRLLGAGAYGNLYVGRFADIDDRGVDRCCPAFVKVLVDAPGPEVDRLLQIGHENLVGLRAVVVGTDVGQPSCLVYEGLDDAVDLHQYLVLRRMRDEGGEEGMDPSTVDWRQSVAVQVATALDYLASVGLVHRDVAARNVVISTRKDSVAFPSTKLSDFSLSGYPYADDYFRFSGGAGAGMPLPVRWLAPEALFSGRYSEASDAWSYGVMLWEMFCGQALTRPFEHHSDEQLVDAMAGRTGRRPTLPCIRGCPPTTYSLMTECWKDMPVRRPRFSTILDRLDGPCRVDPSGQDTSPAGGSDSTGVTVVASMTESPHLTASRTSSFRTPQWPAGQTVCRTDSASTRRPFSPPSARYPLRQTGSPLAPRSNSIGSADSANFGVLM